MCFALMAMKVADYPCHLHIIHTIYTYFVPFYKSFMPFTDHPYHFTSMPIIDCLFCLQNIYTVYQIILAFIDHPYYFIDPLCRLQNIHTIYRSSIPFYRTSIPFCSKNQKGHVCMSWPVRLLSTICSQLCLLLPL